MPSRAAFPPNRSSPGFAGRRRSLALLLLDLDAARRSTSCSAASSATSRYFVLLPAVPAALLLYALAIWSWRESWVAVIGVTLVFFWVILAVSAPYLPLLDPNKPVAPFVTPFTEKNGIFYWLGTDTRGRDMLSRTIWGCQRVLVWGITATTVAYVVGTAARPHRRLSRRLVGPGRLVPRQRAPLLPGDGAVHPDPELSRAERLQHRHRRDLLLRAGDHAHRPRPGARREVARLHLRGADARRASDLRSWWWSSCRTCAGRSSSMPACASATRRSPSPR